MAISSLFGENDYTLWAKNLHVTGEADIHLLSNEGGGSEVYDENTIGGLRTLEGTANGLEVAQTGSTITIDNTLTCANLTPAGAMVGQVFAAKTGSTLGLRSIVAGLNVTVSETPTSIEINSSGVSGLSGASNEGGGAGTFDTIAGTTLVFRSLVGSSNGLAVTQNATTIEVDNTLTGANLGGGAGVFSAKSGAALQFNSLVAGPNIGITAGAGAITIDASSAVTTLSNEGGGAQVWDSGTPATLRTLFGTANGLAVTQGATAITVDNTLTGSNLGSGTGLFSSKSGAALQFNSLAAGAGISLSLASNTITVSGPTTWVVAEVQSTGTFSMPGVIWTAVTQIPRWLNSIQGFGPDPGKIALNSAANNNTRLVFQPGTYYVTGSATKVNTSGTDQLFLRNVTAGTTLVSGQNSGSSAPVEMGSLITGVFTVAAAGTLVDLAHYRTSANPDGYFGLPTPSPVREVYTTLTFVSIG
jgi:hypothetical protein